MSHYKLLVEGETRRLNTQDVGYARLLQEVMEMSGGQADLVLGYFNPDREWMEIASEADFLAAVQTSSPKSLVRIMATKSDITAPPAMTASIFSTDRPTTPPPSTNQQEPSDVSANQNEGSVAAGDTMGVDAGAVGGAEGEKNSAEGKERDGVEEDEKEGEVGVRETARTLPDILTGEIMPFMMSARSRSRKQQMEDSEDDDGFLVVDDVTGTSDPYDDAGEQARYAQQRALEEREYEHQLKMEQSLLEAARELQRLSTELGNTLATLDRRNEDLVDLTHKIADLESEKTELESAHNTTQETLATLQSDLTTAKSEIDRLASILVQANTDATDLQAQIDEKSEIIRSMEERVKMLEGEIEKRETAMAETIETHHVEVERVTAEREEEKSLAEGVIGEMRTEIESMQAQIKSANSTIKEREDEVTKLTCDLDSEKNVSLAEREIQAKMGLEINDLKVQIAAKEEEIARVQSNLDSIRAEAEGHKQRIGELEGEIAGVRSDLESIRADAEGHKQRVCELETLLAAANGTGNELASKVKDLEACLADMTEQHQQAENDLQSAVGQIKSRDTAKATVEGELRRVGEVLRKTEEDLARTRRQLELQQRNSHEWPRQLLEMQNTLRRERERADSYEAKWRAANGVSGAMTDLDTQLKRAEAQAASAAQRVSEVETELKNANEQVAMLIAREETMKRKLEDTTKAVVRAVKQASEYQDQLRQAQTQMAPPTSSPSTSNTEISTLRTQLSAAVSRADSAETRQVELDRLVRELRAEIDSMVRTRPVNLIQPDPFADTGSSGLVGDVDVAESQMEETCADVRDTVCVTVNEERNSLMTYIEEVATSIEQEEGPQNRRSLIFGRPIPTISEQIRQEGVQISDVCQKTLETFDERLTDCLDTHRAMLLGSRVGPGANGPVGDVARECIDGMNRLQKEVLDHVIQQVRRATEKVDELTMNFYKNRQD